MKLIFAGLLLCVAANAKHLPSFVKSCKQSQPDFDECFKNAILDLKPRLLDGIPEMGLPTMNPLFVPFLSLDSGSGGSFQLKLDVTNASISGLSDVFVDQIKINTKDDTMTFDLKFPLVKVTGKYKASGKMLVVPINGEGDLTFNFEKNFIKGVLKAKKTMRKGKEYYKFEQESFKIGITGGSGEFGNLFANSKELTDSTNKLFNENFDIAVKDFEPALELLLSGILLQFTNTVHQRYPIVDLYPA